MLAAVVLLGACRVDADVEVIVTPAGTGEVVVTVTADADVVDAAPDIAEDLRVDDLAATGWVVEGPTPTADGGLQVVLRHPFASLAEANAILTELGGPQGPLRDVTLDVGGTSGDLEWTLDGQLDFSAGLEALADPELVALTGGTPWLELVGAQGLDPTEVAGVSFRATLPGVPVDTNGSTVPPGSGEFSANAGDAPVQMSLRTVAASTEVLDARDLEDRMMRYLVWYGVAIALLVVGVLAWRGMRRRARTR
jgi:hypothetical protein